MTLVQITALICSDAGAHTARYGLFYHVYVFLPCEELVILFFKFYGC